MATNKQNQQVTKSKSKASKSKAKENIPAVQKGGQSTAFDEESETIEVVLKRLEDMEVRFMKEQEEKQELEAVIAALQAQAKEHTVAKSSTEEMIPRPTGTCSTNWSLQIEMKLSGSASKEAKYKGLLRGMRDLVLNAGLNWEVGWRDISSADKSKLFQVARERYPILKLYVNDWATAEIIKQYMKNKRAHHYNNGWLEVPEKFSYLKENARKRNPSGSRVKRVKVEAAAKKRAKRNNTSANHSRTNETKTQEAGDIMDEDEDEDEDSEEDEKGKNKEGEGEDEYELEYQ